jgi:hypothetical protein
MAKKGRIEREAKDGKLVDTEKNDRKKKKDQGILNKGRQ